MTPDSPLILFLVFFGIQNFVFCRSRVQDVEPNGDSMDKSYLEDVKNQLLAGIKDVRRMAEKAVESNTRSAEVATEMTTEAVQIRKTLAADDEETYRSSSDQETGNEKTQQAADPTVPEITLSQIDAQVNYKLFSARKDFALVEKIEQRTSELLQKFSKEDADPEKNRYYEQRGGHIKQAMHHLIEYQKYLQNMRVALLKLRNLEAAFKDSTGKDFSSIPLWKTDGNVAISLVKSLKTDLYVKTIKETEQTDYFIENLEKPVDAADLQRSFLSNIFGSRPDPKPNTYGVGMGFGVNNNDGTIQSLVQQAGNKYNLFPAAKPKNLSLLKCLVTNILTLLGELYQCIRGEPPEEPEGELPPQIKYNPRLPIVVPVLCTLKPTFRFIIGAVVCLAS